MGKGGKEALAPFGGVLEGYLKTWLLEYQPDGYNIYMRRRKYMRIR